MTQQEDKLTIFTFSSTEHPVKYIESQQVKDGVECDIYEFAEDTTKDLAVVRVSAGSKTPLQLVMSGKETVEIFGSGFGVLCIWSSDGMVNKYPFKDGDTHGGQTVLVGERMQWQADKDHSLMFYEVCTPPYKDGRFKDLEE